jgi:RNA polymerase sigma-70 factor (ECF subfamily)
MHTHTECQLVARVLAGNTDAFEALLAPHEPALLRTVRRLLSNPADADEALQETRLKAFTALSQFEGRASFRTWLVRILINEVRMMYRTRRRAVFVPAEQAAGVLETLRSPEPSIQDKLVALSLRQSLRRAVAKLPAGYRAVLSLRAVEEASIAEAAQQLRLSITAVKARQFRAVRMLRAEMQRGASVRACRTGRR